MDNKQHDKLMAWRKRAAEVVRSINGQVPNALVLSGAAALSAGIAMIYRPAGVIAAGICLIITGVMMMAGGDGH